MIGSKGIVAEIDETKLRKRKYNRVIGGVECSAERKIFMLPIEFQNADSIVEIIARHVKPGSIIHTDLWKDYSCIKSEFGCFQHRTVNHSKEFKDSLDGTHTNTIGGA